MPTSEMNMGCNRLHRVASVRLIVSFTEFHWESLLAP